jgi:hypothetical protein
MNQVDCCIGMIVHQVPEYAMPCMQHSRAKFVLAGAGWFTAKSADGTPRPHPLYAGWLFSAVSCFHGDCA